MLTYVRDHSELYFGNGQLFYIRWDGVIHVLYKSNNNWIFNYLNPNAPRVKERTGFVLVPEQNNTIYYIGKDDGKVYKLAWSTSGWQYSILYNSNLNIQTNSEIQFGNDQFFYIRNDNVLCCLYNYNGSWSTNPLNSSLPLVKQGSGFRLIPEQNNTVYYVGNDNNLYKAYWSGTTYTSIKINPSIANMSGALNTSCINYLEGDIYYVGLSDSKIHSLSYVNNVPFSYNGTTIGQTNTWDVQGTDGLDYSYKFYLPTATSIDFTTCNTTTNYDTKIEIFKQNGSRAGFYNDDYTCTLSSLYSTIEAAHLDPGIYYAVVDGYGSKTGNFRMSVSKNLFKSSFILESNLDHVIGDYDDIGKYDTLKLSDYPKSNALEKNDGTLSIFPNPASSTFKIISSINNLNNVSLLDLQGREIFNYTGDYTTEININCHNILPGIYFVKIVFSNEIKTYKLIIN